MHGSKCPINYARIVLFCPLPVVFSEVSAEWGVHTFSQRQSSWNLLARKQMHALSAHSENRGYVERRLPKHAKLQLRQLWGAT